MFEEEGKLGFLLLMLMDKSWLVALAILLKV